jgi:CRISPR-associated endonuclease/helicase Cas3
MVELRAEHFRDFFQELHGKPPFPWQEALAARVCAGDWPEVIDLPTASGKTACIDIALFALAVRGNEAPRRIFFVVDRRVVVNEAYLRMCRVRDRLKEAKVGLLYEIAQRFRSMGCGDDMPEQEDDPLLVAQMRGGTFRDETWVTNPLQPAVIASTVDQVGSRLLFRGYGVSQNTWPLHAGLIGNDALILLDEAHCSRAFAQTLKRIERYRGKGWANQPLALPFQFVEMTATPSRDVKPENKAGLSAADLGVEALRKRLDAEKPTQLIEIKGRKNDTEKLVDALATQALALASDVDARRVALFANRVKTAKLLCARLRERIEGIGARVELVIGSMRPVDREDLERRLSDNFKSDRQRDPAVPLTFVVSTQCLEVGADLDFDVLVTECAAVDALLQRFGRLDRLGNFERARGAIVIGSWQIDTKQPDPVYGEALAKTWAWLKHMAGESGRVNMGIRSRVGEIPTIKESLEKLAPGDKRGYYLPAPEAAILLPAHVDMLAQTSPIPAPDPLIEVFLHGRQPSAPEVQVVWRNDIENTSEKTAVEIIRFCPPSSREAMPVSIAAFRRWLANEKDVLATESDLESGNSEEETPTRSSEFEVIAWDGEDGHAIRSASEIKPGQTLILKSSSGGWNDLGYIPEDAPIDAGDRAAFTVRNGVSLRLHPEVIAEWPETPSRQAVIDYVSNEGAEREEVQGLLSAYREELEQLTTAQQRAWPFAFLRVLDELRRKLLDPYPGGKAGYILRGRRGKPRGRHTEQVLLVNHLADVEKAVGKMAGRDKDLRDALVRSARLHDCGKADIRFQAWLRGGDQMAARYSPKAIAKSGNDVLLAQKEVGLPEGFRHELLSLLFAEKSPEAEGEMRDLILHLVAAHHGRCRPFAPVIPDTQAKCASFNGIAICKEERVVTAPHRLDRGIPDRFWRLTAAYGWWGLAYLESLLRLADWRASSAEAAEVSYE